MIKMETMTSIMDHKKTLYIILYICVFLLTPCITLRHGLWLPRLLLLWVYKQTFKQLLIYFLWWNIFFIQIHGNWNSSFFTYHMLYFIVCRSDPGIQCRSANIVTNPHIAQWSILVQYVQKQSVKMWKKIPLCSKIWRCEFEIVSNISELQG